LRLFMLITAAALSLNGWVLSDQAGQSKSKSAIHRKQKQADQVTRDDKADETARNGLSGIRSLISEKNFKDFGLQSSEEAAQLELGNPVPLYYVRADQLKEYQPGSDAGRLMVNANRRLYPVLLKNEGKLLITVEKTATGWRMVSFGQADIAPALTKIKREKVARTTLGPGSSSANYFVVQIPSMHLNFLAYAPAPGPGGSEESKRQVVLTPLASSDQLAKSIGFQNSKFLALNPSFSSEKQGSRNANEVFKALAPNAVAASSVSAPQ
jgi:hypothetical protein